MAAVIVIVAFARVGTPAVIPVLIVIAHGLKGI